ncbi:caspase family protein [Nannocystis sp. ILAH1]|uniref:caspase family protein n=1 Tax=unclassified Nannocystis TaxID=2627009 RepID=UPI002270054A|nr:MULTISPECIES: caspase family protein [unclassified Nannocystis]MCY0994098.1 caspase family protein [Nannocystis sp. ILAH1]MCY1067062.1 caspase family protein [Nannocystis sp. RBIL2]
MITLTSLAALTLSSALTVAPREPVYDDAAAVPVPQPQTRRVALIVGANDGGPGRVKLRYAGSDAKALSRVLADVGGIDRRDAFVLLDPNPTQLLDGFRWAQDRVAKARAAGERVQFLFYYSGHADDRGVHLGASQIDYPKLRGLIHAVDAQVRLGLLDSCSSGAFVRLKGGKMRPPLSTGDANIQGHAFLTSSSAEEAAQESDRIGGSYFTHYLVSGLRGAADVNRDRRVTLHEAYRFAFDETLKGTETTLGRAQHPVYDIQLVGTGDLVMTDLRETSAVLDIHSSVGGRVYVRDADGRLAAELYKGVGAGAVSLALEPGRYSVVIDDGAKMWRGTVDVRPGVQNELTRAELTAVGAETTTMRGDEVPIDPSQYRVMPFQLGLVYPLTTNKIEKQRKVINRFSLNLILGRAAQIHGVEVSSGGNWVDEDVRGVQLSAGANYVGGNVHGLQSTAGVNIVGGNLSGVQGAAGFNSVGGDAHGVQAAAGVNLVRGHMRGIQAVGGVNWARSVAGAQIAPVNVTKEIRGAQVGVIGVAAGKVRGAQIGVINYADEADAQVGVLNVTRKGGIYADIWTSDIAALNLAVKFRAKYTYSFLAIGLHPAGQGRGFMSGLGFGGHIPIKQRFYLDIDLATYWAQPQFRFRDNPALINSLRVMFGWQENRRFAVWGGPTLNLDIDFQGGRERMGYGWVVTRAPIDPHEMRVWPGFVVGISL